MSASSVTAPNYACRTQVPLGMNSEKKVRLPLPMNWFPFESVCALPWEGESGCSGEMYSLRSVAVFVARSIEMNLPDE